MVTICNVKLGQGNMQMLFCEQRQIIKSRGTQEKLQMVMERQCSLRDGQGRPHAMMASGQRRDEGMSPEASGESAPGRGNSSAKVRSQWRAPHLRDRRVTIGIS